MAASSLQQCPDCSRIVRFSSDETNMIICGSCGSVLWRDRNGQLTVTPQFPLLQKNDIIQPGTTGSWQSQRFTVLGRFRAWLEESVFNYWTIRFDDGKIAWLGEGYGIYCIMQPMAAATDFDYRKLRGANNGTWITLKPGASFMLKKKLASRKWEVEGELYVPSNSANITIADFSAEDGSHITVFEWGEKQVHFYEVRFTEFAVLSFENLRLYTPAEKQFTCIDCSATIHVKTFPYAQSCACAQCGACYEMANGMDFNKDSTKKVRGIIHLPIGSKGSIDEISYEVIGYTHKQENNLEKAEWSEYTLFNPQAGFLTLSVFAGHWIVVKEKGDSPVITSSSFQKLTYDNEPFHLYNTYSYKVLGAAGEFPYNIFDNQKAKAREFISPPEMWIEERSPDEGVTWYFGKHINSKKVQQAFSVAEMPAKSGVGALQPTGFINSSRLVMMSLWGILLLCLVHILINMSKQERVLLDKVLAFPDSSNTTTVVTDKFHLDKWRSNLEFDIEASVNNSWFELGATLVNSDNGKEYSLEKGVEYYSGYSEGEHWSEGSQQSTAYLTKIPEGNYFLQLQGSREPATLSATPSINSFSIRVIYDVPTYRNLFWSIGLLLIWPVVTGFIVHQREASRWFSSTFSTENE